MTFVEFFKRFLTVLIVLLLVVMVWAASTTLLLGFAAVLLAVAITIPTRWLQRWGMRRGWAMVISVLLATIAAALLALLVLPRLVAELWGLLAALPDATRAIFDSYQQLRTNSKFLTAALPALSAIGAATANIDPERARQILEQFFATGLIVGSTLWGGVSALAAVLIDFAVVMITATFFLVDPNIYIKGSLYLIPRPYHERAIQIWNELYHALKTWIVALSLTIASTVGLIWLILGLLLGMPNALVIAVFAGLAAFVPNIGLFLPLIPMIIFSLAVNPAGLLIYIPVYLLIQMIENNVITPSIVQAELKIPAGVLLLFQLLMILAFGAIGLILSVPVFAAIMVLVRELYSYDLLGLRPIQVSLAADAAGDLVLKEQPMLDAEQVKPSIDQADHQGSFEFQPPDR